MPLATTSLQHLGPLGTSAVPGAGIGSLRLPGGAVTGVDPKSLQNLKSNASKDPKAAVDQAARQFEALFMQELMKSMRQATLNSGMLENSGTQMGTEMLDSQFALKMTGMPGGLSQAIARQLLRAMEGPADGAAPAGDPQTAPAGVAGQGLRPLTALPPRLSAATATVPEVIDARSIRDDQARAVARRSPHALQFTQQHTAAARAVEAESGIPAAFMIGQAAHETGWGRKEILHADGRTSHNLFGIKAGAGWTGPVAEITTTEYIDGSPRKLTARFRAYASYEESFRDYARLMQNSQRYSGVMQDIATQGATVREFATGLQRAGYATDPAYADKLSRVINTTLHLQRSLG